MTAAGPLGLTELEAAAAAAKVKRHATLAAALALRGFELREQSDGTWLVCKWNLAQPAPTLDDVELFARSVGAPA